MKKPCSIDGCDRLSNARGWCGLHYERWKRHGDPNYQKPDWHGTPSGYTYRRCRCDACCQAAYASVRRWKAANKEQQKKYRTAYDRKRYYGISQEEYDQMCADQGGVCAICGSEPQPGKLLCVDHNHDTNAIRALLCQHCNQGIGFFKEDAYRMLSAIEYLKKHRPLKVVA